MATRIVNTKELEQTIKGLDAIKGHDELIVFCQSLLRDIQTRVPLLITEDYPNKIKDEIKENVITFPCEIGDKVWYLRTNKEAIYTTVEKIGQKRNGSLFVKLSCNSVYDTPITAFGRTIFFTEEEARKALKKKRDLNYV